MSEMTARERIEQALRRAYHQGRNEVDPSDEAKRIEAEADSIIAIVREALLSEEAKEAASHFASYDDIPVIVDSLLNAGLGTRFVTDGYDEPLGSTND